MVSTIYNMKYALFINKVVILFIKICLVSLFLILATLASSEAVIEEGPGQVDDLKENRQTTCSEKARGTFPSFY